jgi:hypothetical protein
MQLLNLSRPLPRESGGLTDGRFVVIPITSVREGASVNVEPSKENEIHGYKFMGTDKFMIHSPSCQNSRTSLTGTSSNATSAATGIRARPPPSTA